MQVTNKKEDKKKGRGASAAKQTLAFKSGNEMAALGSLVTVSTAPPGFATAPPLAEAGCSTSRLPREFFIRSNSYPFRPGPGSPWC
jgi:hypothetical protein